ncbi:MAG: metal-dependent transcriptional regulator [Desulfococcaceae bacterium]
MVPRKTDESREKPLTTVMEDYLEAIYELDQRRQAIRVKDIAREMDVKMPSVSSMLKNLRDRGLVHYQRYEYVELTPEGAEVGREMRRRHRILKKFLVEILQIPPKTADDEACRMEHALSAETLDSLTDFMAFIQSCPRAGESWLQFFKEYRESGRNPEACARHAENFTCEFQRHVDSLKKSVES